MIVIGATLFASISSIGRLRHDRAILEWNTRFGSLEDLLARHPSRDANASALRLEELSAALGIDRKTLYRRAERKVRRAREGEVTEQRELGDAR